MNTDLEVITKELEYISLCIKLCVNIDVFCELIGVFDNLNILYKHLSGESFKEPEHPYIDDEVYYMYLDEKDNKINEDFLKRYEEEKAFISPIVLNYLKKFNDCEGDLHYTDEVPKIYSVNESKEIILDYFSQFDKRIYDVVVSTFDNHLIQTGMSDTYNSSQSLRKLEYYIDMFGELNPEDYTEESTRRLIRFYKLIAEKLCSDDYITDDRYDAYSERLTRHYNDLIPTNNDFVKKNIDYDDCGEYLAFAFVAAPLKKTYIATLKENIDIQTIISIVHEFGHAIEDKISIFEKDELGRYDTAYLSEISSSFFEYEFIKYLTEKGIDTEFCEDHLFDYYMDIYDAFALLYDTFDATPDEKTECGQVTYRNDEYESSIDLNNRVKYGFNRYLAIVMNKKFKDRREEFYDLLKHFLNNRETLRTSELLDNFGISNEDLLDISFCNEDIDKLIKRYNN